MAKGQRAGKKAGRASGRGSLLGMRKGFKGIVRGGDKPRADKRGSFWNVLTWLLLAFAAGLLVIRLAS